MKNVFQKICALCLIIATILTNTACALAFDNVPELEEPTVLAFSEQVLPELLDSADVITIDYQNLEDIADCAKTLVDNGKIICIFAPEASNEEIAGILSIPNQMQYAYNPYVLVATYIYKIADIYVIGNDWLIPANLSTMNLSENAALGEEDTQYDFDSITLFSDVSFAVDKKTAIQNNSVENAITCAKDNEENYVAVTPSEGIMPLDVPTIGSDTKISPGSAQVVIETGDIIGQCAATQYIYPVGYREIIVDDDPTNTKISYVYSVVTSFSATPTRNYYCTGFTGRMKCNTSDILLDHVNLSGSDNGTITLSVGYSQKNGTTIGASWSYNRYGHTHRTYYAGPNAYDYRISATIFNNSELNLIPGICVGTDAAAGSRSNYSDMIVPDSCFAVGSSAVSFTVGGRF